MLRNEKEYKSTIEQIAKLRKAIEEQKSILAAKGLTFNQIKRSLAPLKVLHIEMQDEIKEYKQTKRGEIKKVYKLEELGRALIAIRISRNLSSRELAKRLGVNESEVSRYEGNEYYSITVKGAVKILDALGVTATIKVIPRERKK